MGVGVPLHADLDYLELFRDVIEGDADFFEVNPETLWRVESGRLVRNDYHGLFRDLQVRSKKPFVAHGLAFSIRTSLESDAARVRTDAWLERLKDDHATFHFQWLTEHLGWTHIDGLEATLPLPLPFTNEAVRTVGARMRLLKSVVSEVGFENGADYFTLGNPAVWPDFINRLCAESACGLLLDLHNLYTQCLNLDQDAEATLDRLDLDHVFEIHLSGGSESPPDWLPSRRVMRLDSHDGPVPEPVWRLLERGLPRCRNLRGLVVERLNGTFEVGDVPALRDEVRRAKELVRC